MFAAITVQLLVNFFVITLVITCHTERQPSPVTSSEKFPYYIQVPYYKYLVFARITHGKTSQKKKRYIYLIYWYHKTLRNIGRSNTFEILKDLGIKYNYWKVVFSFYQIKAATTKFGTVVADGIQRFRYI